MKQNKISFVMVLVFFFSLFSCGVGNTGENTDVWVYYGTTDHGSWYYDNENVKEVSPNNIIRVREKVK
jgi:hypothetical protein